MKDKTKRPSKRDSKKENKKHPYKKSREEFKVNHFFVLLTWLAILAYIFTSNDEIFRVIIISFIVAMTLDNYNPNWFKKMREEK